MDFMDLMEFKPAQRKRAKLRLGITGPSGSGKTYSALLIASGIAPWNKIAIIDSENGSAELYSDLGGYSALTLSPPYSPEKYIDAIHLAEKSGFEVIIIDSLSHAWNGEGGILDQQGKAADTKYKGNSWAAWRECTPKHNALVEAMLKSSCHIVATMRSKTEYMQITENGKPAIKKLGMAPIQRDGMDYEFTTVFDLSIEHIAVTSKDRTGIFDGQYFKPSVEIGEKMLHWLNYESHEIIKELAVQEDIATPSVPALSPETLVESQVRDGDLTVVPNEAPNDDLPLYRIMNSEAKAKSNGQVFARLVLLNKESRILAWTADSEILNVPVGTLISATLSKKNGTHILESYNIVKGGEAA